MIRRFRRKWVAWRGYKQLVRLGWEPERAMLLAKIAAGLDIPVKLLGPPGISTHWSQVFPPFPSTYPWIEEGTTRGRPSPFLAAATDDEPQP
ncbi:hypothetical protein [Desertimonas flava]|uniref:hypothetical protein n=1 Tax=Desertimonas flava TaxID=2064846 RepID=UPI000E349A40|nr:hypothetical protein [Desertimonas flava]